MWNDERSERSVEPGRWWRRATAVARRALAPLTLAALGVVAALSLGLEPGCTVHQCKSYYVVPSYLVHVQDASGTPICDASVSIDSFAVSPNARCGYSATIPSSSSASLQVKRTGYVPVERSLSTRYTTDSCGHAIPVQVNVVLKKAP